VTVDMRFVGDHPENELIDAIIALAIAAHLEAEDGAVTRPVTRVTRWVVAGRLEARGISVSDASLRSGWRAGN
jgi:hypothetical protein